ncbi:L domain-like protein [Anaeromyces robustus]|uniref:L domain-like protein n=1 Tax=Anaeromyces robustus TaxID=1754192 RepID=A0A1Y1XCF7_9FUNG|nr:L domain-like protein [Anaeromyces robustus]|eukprot:ORX83450.1 L domain-like protein [Anaeromyces robustus]
MIYNIMNNFHLTIFFLIGIFTVKTVIAINQCDILKEILTEISQGVIDLTPYPSENMNCCQSDTMLIGCKGLGNERVINNIEFNGEKMNITKPIPEKIVELKDIERIGLTKVKTIEVPEYLASLPKLSVLEIFETNAGSRIPPVIGTFKNLESLVLSGNNFCNKIPEELKSLTKLTYIEISNNMIDSPIPDIFDSFPNLVTLVLSNNALIGNIPSSITNLPQLKKLDLSKNIINGYLPRKIGNLENLEELNVENNRLHGTIPVSLKELKNLKILNLKDNEFDGIPDFISELPSLKQLELSDSGLYGSIPQLPDSIKTCTFDRKNFCSSFKQTCIKSMIECTPEIIQKEENFKKIEAEIRKKEEEALNDNDSDGNSLMQYIVSLSLILLTLIGLYTFLRCYNWYHNRKDDEILIKQIDNVNNNNPLYKLGFFSKEVNSDVGSEANMLVSRPSHFSEYNNSNSLSRSIFNDSEVSDNGHMDHIDQIEREMIQKAINNSLKDMGPAYTTNTNFNDNTNTNNSMNRNFNSMNRNFNSMNRNMNSMNRNINSMNRNNNSMNRINYGNMSHLKNNFKIQTTNQQFKAGSPLQTNIHFNSLSPTN